MGRKSMGRKSMSRKSMGRMGRKSMGRKSTGRKKRASRKPSRWAKAVKQAYRELGLKKFESLKRGGRLYNKTRQIYDGVTRSRTRR